MSDETTLQWVKALEDKRCQAMLAADSAILNTLLDPGFVYVHASGARDSRDSYLKKLSSGALRYESLTLLPVSAFAINACLVADARMQAMVYRAGGSGCVDSCYTAMWLPTPEGWQLLAIHAIAAPIAG